MENRKGSLAFVSSTALLGLSLVPLTLEPTTNFCYRRLPAFIHPLDSRLPRGRGQAEERLELKPPSQSSVTNYFNKTGHCPVHTPVCACVQECTHNDSLASLVLVPLPKAPSLPSPGELGEAYGESGVEKSCQVKAASPGSARGQAGSHHSLSEVSTGDRHRWRLQRPLGVCTRA